MALRFKIKHLFGLLLVAAVLCGVVMQRRMAISKYRSLESRLAAEIEVSKEAFQSTNPDGYKIVRDLDLKVLGPRQSVEIGFFGSKKSYQYEVADRSLEVYVYAKLELGLLSSSIPTVIEYADEFPDDPYREIASYVEFVLKEKLGINDVALSKMEP